MFSPLQSEVKTVYTHTLSLYATGISCALCAYASADVRGGRGGGVGACQIYKYLSTLKTTSALL